MMIKMRPVTVQQIPEHVTAATERNFLHNLQEYVETERPRLVLDCSLIRRMDNSTIHLLLSCLEEGMKRNGDVKLAALSSSAEERLRMTGVDRLFERYASTAEAVHSYNQRPGIFSPLAGETGGFDRESENAA